MKNETIEKAVKIVTLANDIERLNAIKQSLAFHDISGSGVYLTITPNHGGKENIAMLSSSIISEFRLESIMEKIQEMIEDELTETQDCINGYCITSKD